MKVLLTADSVGGVWTYALDLCRGLSARGHAITLALSGPPAGAARLTEAREAGATVVETGLPLDWLADDADQVLRAGRAHAALAREVGADIVHLNSPALAAEAAFPCPVVGFCHSCVATWWHAVRPGPLPADFRWRMELVSRGYARCDALAAPSAAFAGATQGAYDLSARPVVIHNGRPTPSLSPPGRGRVGEADRVRGQALSGEREPPSPHPLPAGERDPAPDPDQADGRPTPPLSPPGRGRVGEADRVRGRALSGEREPPSPYPLPAGERDPAPGEDGVVSALTAGRLWDEAKNLATLERAATRTAVPIVAAGPTCGPNGARVDLRDVHALGPLSGVDLAERLARQPIFISLARYEPFGLAVLEAAQAGCPLVLSDIPTFRELWDGAAIFVDAQDDRAAAAALDGLAGDASGRARRGALARVRAASYGAERMVAGTLALYRSTIAGAGANALRAAS